MVGQSKRAKKDPRCGASKSVTESVTGSHQFTVVGYSQTKGMGVGKYTSSDVFSVGGHDWEIRLYPDGETAALNASLPDKSSFTVRIALVSDAGTDVRASFKLSILDKSGKSKQWLAKQTDGTLAMNTKLGPTSWGYYVPDKLLASFNYRPKDCFVVEGTVQVVTTRHEKGGKQDSSITVPGSNLSQGLKQLLESEVGWDVVFHVGDESFRDHKSILAARSPYFGALLFGLAGDPNLNEVIVADDEIHPSIFKAMLVFIYTDELPDVNDIMRSLSSSSSSSSSISGATNILQHLLVAADMYNLERLKVFCESKLCEELTAVSVATVLAFADQHHCAQLKAVCLEFAANPANLGVMMQSEGFKHLQESCPTLLSELLKTLASSSTDDDMMRRVRRRY